MTTPSEKDVLKKMDISNFRHVTKDKIMAFTSSMSKIDPEVAKKILDQFPYFTKMGLGLGSESREITNKLFDSNKEGSERVHNSYEKKLDVLYSKILNEDLSNEENSFYMEEIDKTIKSIEQKDEFDKKITKKFILNI